MNTLVSTFITSPLNKQEECAQFVIDNTSESFIMYGVVAATGQYTFSFWIRSDSDGQLFTCGTTVDTTTSWVKQKITFSATESDIQLLFGTSGVYYIYRPILEAGNISSDWTPAPEDITDSINKAQGTADTALSNASVAQSAIQQIADSISTLVTDGNGTSLMTQTATGWTFSIGELENTLSTATKNIDNLTGDVNQTANAVENLKNAVNDLGVLANYIKITVDGDQPCIELGESDNNFKVRITNTEIHFADGTVIPTRITRQMMIIEKAMVRNELQFGDDEDTEISGVWIWKRRSNGNLGLSWKEVGS